MAEEWSEATLTWNNAPLAVENTPATWVYPVGFLDPAVLYQWDVSQAVARAYAAGDPLLALYSADSAYHCGKCFWSAGADLALRHLLRVLWGDPLFDLTMALP